MVYNIINFVLITLLEKDVSMTETMFIKKCHFLSQSMIHLSE